MVLSGKITSKSKVKVFRGEEMVYEGSLTSLRRFKDDVKEVATNYECGIGVDGVDLKEGDQIEAYVLEAVAQKLID
jgi:translation initiation factor IF-2